MNKVVFTYLKSYSSDPFVVNRLIVSAYLYSKKLKGIHNQFISQFEIQETDSDFKPLMEFLEIQSINSFEQLIELFEFVISPQDKIVNGAVYTPEYIRESIVDETINSIALDENTKICDPACGCSGFLLSATKCLRKNTTLSFEEIFRNHIYGLDIEEYSITRSKILLTLLALSEGEDKREFSFNLYIGNALEFVWSRKIEDFSGFQVVLGNPPYVCSRNMDDKTRELIENWEVAKTGHPDLYIPFFQLGYENLAQNGVLGFITVNTFIKSVNGRALRDFFSINSVNLKIINFGGEQLFKSRNTYTCICYFKKNKGGVKYKKILSSQLSSLKEQDFYSFDYKNLNNHDGWNLVDSKKKSEYIKKIESIGKPFKDLYVTKNGIATLMNRVYKFIPKREDKEFFYLKTKEGKEYAIEKEICRDIVNANKIHSERDLELNKEKIIFPYVQKNNEARILDENVFIASFPQAYQYLQDHKTELSTRDKGKREYEKWYAYGRRQSMNINACKLFFPHISEKPTFVISTDRDLLFYNGIAVISNDFFELQVLKRILESDIFYDYIKSNTKDYASGYISMSRNYIKNFGVCNLTTDEKHALLLSKDPNSFLRKIYGLDKDDVYPRRTSDLQNVAEPRIRYN